MVPVFFAAFTMGLLGSFHCIGMCGPLALSLPVSSDNFLAKLTGTLLYNFGRIITYVFFGLFFGLVGRTFGFFGYQQWLSILLGLLILLFVILPKTSSILKGSNFLYASLYKLREILAKLFRKKNFSSLFFIGLLNGLLPCGLVYMAAAGAIATGNLFNSIFFMAFFGLGTLPAMWGIAFFGNFINVNVRQQIRKAYPYMMVLMASLLILRGMGLGIPYVSPKMNMEKKAIQDCYVRPAEKK